MAEDTPTESINYDLPLTVILITYPRTLTLSQNIRMVELL